MCQTRLRPSFFSTQISRCQATWQGNAQIRSSTSSRPQLKNLTHILERRPDIARGESDLSQADDVGLGFCSWRHGVLGRRTDAWCCAASRVRFARSSISRVSHPFFRSKTHRRQPYLPSPREGGNDSSAHRACPRKKDGRHEPLDRQAEGDEWELLTKALTTGRFACWSWTTSRTCRP